MNKHINGAVRLSAAIAALLLTWQASAAEQPKELNLGILGGQIPNYVTHPIILASFRDCWAGKSMSY